MIVIASVELPESVDTKAPCMLAVAVIEIPDDRVIYCGAAVCGQDFAF